MNKYSTKYQFAPGHIVKLSFESQNNLTEAYLKIKLDKLKEKFQKENPELFTESFQEYAKKEWEKKELAHEMKMCNYVDAMLEGMKSDPASIQEGMDLLNKSFQFKV